MIKYKENIEIKVYSNDKHIGTINNVGDNPIDGYTYTPKGRKPHDKIYSTISELKWRIQKEHHNPIKDIYV